MVKWYGEHTLVNRHVVLVFGSQVQYNVRNAHFWLPTPFLAKVLSKHPFLKTKGTNSKRKLLGFIQFTWNRSVMVQYLYMMNFCRTFSTMFLKNSWPCASGPKFIDAGVFALFFPLFVLTVGFTKVHGKNSRLPGMEWRYFLSTKYLRFGCFKRLLILHPACYTNLIFTCICIPRLPHQSHQSNVWAYHKCHNSSIFQVFTLM